MKQAKPKKQNDQSNDITTRVQLIHGLFLIRLIETNPVDGWGAAHISTVQVGDGGKVAYFQGCGVTQQTLRKPGDCIVVRNDSEHAEILIKYDVKNKDVLKNYYLKIDRVDDSGKLSLSPAKLPDKKQAGKNITEDKVSPELLQKTMLPLAMVGRTSSGANVLAKPWTWLGDPDGDEALLELTVVARSLPEGLVIALTPEVFPIGKLPESTVNQCLGLIDYGLPLTGMSISLKGEASDRYLILAEASFKDFGIIEKQPNKNVILRGPTGKEPMISLRLAIYQA